MNLIYHWIRRYDSLFARLLLLSTALAVGLSVLYFAFYFVERNRAVATLTADRWADALLQAAGRKPALPRLPDQVELRDAPPADAHEASDIAPRVKAFREELARRGLTMHRLAWGSPRQRSHLWVEVDNAQGQAVWLGFEAPIMADREVARLVLAQVGVIALVMGLAWWPARRLTRRLTRLRAHMTTGEAWTPPPYDLGAAPEVVDIERAYADLLGQLARQHSERNLLLAGVSHDLRSPLSRIRMAVELMPDDEQSAARKRSIIANVQAADQLIESFMDLVRSTELPLDQTVDVTEVACKVIAMFDRPDEALHLEAPASVLLHRAHAHLLERALYNLVDNAFKHGAAPVCVRVSETPEGVHLAVQDAGPGVPADQRDWVMQAFSRGDASRGKVGSGLGLAIVRQLVERMRGQVAFEGQAGAWTVLLKLPHRECANPARHNVTPSKESGQV